MMDKGHDPLVRVLSTCDVLLFCLSHGRLSINSPCQKGKDLPVQVSPSGHRKQTYGYQGGGWDGLRLLYT